VYLTHAGAVEELKRGYVTMAVFKGLPCRLVVFRLVLRNVLIPTVTAIATRRESIADVLYMQCLTGAST
jgi:ABC-type dipeptide/oligopeptide/nickel transport system permease component